MPSPRLNEGEFKERFRTQFSDPLFDQITEDVEHVAQAAWDAYAHSHKSPRTRKAGDAFSDPDYDLSVDWISASDAIKRAQRQHDDPSAPGRVLVINGSPRSDHTCPGEMSKSYRLVKAIEEKICGKGLTVDVLDLSRITSEYGRHIHPCKACFSTSPALCHWPCSCYPNYSLGQALDWMNEIYPLWVAAHGVILVTPVHWYQASSPLKLMMDRLVCADGGNTDPTKTHGKNAKEAKEIELAGWDYPKHLAGRLFGVIVHGDTEGAENVRRGLADWLKSMELEAAGNAAQLDRYIGYWKPYATSHQDLDNDGALIQEVTAVATAVASAIEAKRQGKWATISTSAPPAREK
jgi:multimeric flavodoxin WrbA